MDFSYKKASIEDIDFIIETIVEAEKSGTDKLGFLNIFSLSEDEFKTILKNILLRDIPENDLSLSDYIISSSDGKNAGACVSWIEKFSGVSSSILKANLLLEFIPKNNLLFGKKYFPLLQELNIEREAGALQLEYTYVKNEFRGHGIVGKIILEHIEQKKALYPELKKAQIQLVKTNEKAYKAYEKIGFVKVFERKVENSKILSLLPSDTKILMELNI